MTETSCCFFCLGLGGVISASPVPDCSSRDATIAALTACGLSLCDRCSSFTADCRTSSREDLPGLSRVGGLVAFAREGKYVGMAVYRPYLPGTPNLELLYRMGLPDVNGLECIERGGFMVVICR